MTATHSRPHPSHAGDPGNTLDRVIADAGYRGHNAPEHQFKVYTASQKRRITPQRRAAVEPVIGHLKEDHRMGRNFLAYSSGGAIDAVLAAVGYTVRLLLRWLRLLLFRILTAILGTSRFGFS
jgi:IS5 family transposase